jgi:hypothetical protein
MKKTRSQKSCDTVPLSLQIQIHTGSRNTGGVGTISHGKGGGVGDPNHTTAQKLWYSIYNTHFTGCIHEAFTVCKLAHNAYL